MNYLIIILLTFGFLNLKAQSIEKQVIGSTGNTSTSGNIILNATLGELSVATKSGTFILTEGYHQANENTETSVENFDIEVNYTLYPNPSSDVIYIKLDSEETVQATIFIVNSAGQIISVEKNINTNIKQVQFNVASLAKGLYYMNILFDQNRLKKISFIIK